MKPPAPVDASLCLASIALGLWAFSKSNEVVGEFMEPRMAACQRSDIAASKFAEETGYEPYDGRIGFGVMNAFVCIITQFFHDLATNGVGGILFGFGTFITLVPTYILVSMEAGRPDAKGLVRYPIPIAFLSQVLGVSVAFPLLWVPSYILGGGTGPVTHRRILLSTIPAVAYLLFAVLSFFVFEPTSSLWTTSAGILGGPVIVLSFVPLWTSGTSTPSDDKKRSAELSTLPYAVLGGVCFLAWLWVLMLLVQQVGFNTKEFYNLVVWTEEASPCVKFMTIDMTVLWLATVIVIAKRKRSAALEAMGLSFVFGPGAGLSLVLAGLEVDGVQGITSSSPNKED